MLHGISRWATSLLILIVVGGLTGWLVWRCRFDKQIRFLPEAQLAEWIVYPNPPDIASHPVPKPGHELSAVFRRAVILEKVPAKIQIQIRAFENFGLQINGQSVSMPPGRSTWKDLREIDAQRWFTSGTNDIQVTVTNRTGPAALWFVLNAGDKHWASDTTWQVSYADAVWRAARLAKAPSTFPKGNLLRSEEALAGAFSKKLWVHAALLLVSICIVWTVTRLQSRPGWIRPAEIKYAVLGALILIWVVMLVHNFRQLPAIVGFDARHHLDYIRIIQERGELPKADEGWETHQPPLYYMTCATLLRVGGLSVTSAEGVTTLRIFSLILGIAQILTIFASLRILFPNELQRPLLGALMAATVPAQLYHAHYVTNETLFALFTSGAFYFALKLMRDREFSVLASATLGVCMGCALLTKLTGLIFVPVAFAALLTLLLLRRESNFKVWAGTVALPVFVCLLICGRYYWNLWAEGGPFANATRWGYGSGWWQEDGFRTASFYFRFGKALVQPFYSSFHSFWDGMYSTLWGDGLCAGSTSFSSGPPWNYELLAAGYWLALIPTVAIVAGFIMAIVKFIRQSSPQWMLLAGVTVLFVFSAIYFSLVAPGASQVRASFGLMLLVPFCAFFASGLTGLFPKSRGAKLIVGTLVLWFALNALAAHWIPSGSAQAQMLRANEFFRNDQFQEAARHADAGYRKDPSNALLRSILADSWTRLGKTNEARQLAAQALERWPNDPMSHLDAAFDLAQSGRFDEAVAANRRALEIAPAHQAAAKQLVVILSRQKRFAEALTACREALRVAPHDEQLRTWLKPLGEDRTPF